MKYLKNIGWILAAMLTVQCTEEGEKLFPIVENPGWTVVPEDFVAEAPEWEADTEVSTVTPEWVFDMQGTDEVPEWSEPDKSVYPTSMTAVVRLTPFLERFADEQDGMAAYIGNECRGVATKQLVGGNTLYFIQVKAADDEGGNVELRYFSAKTNTLYTSVPEELPYEINKMYGTADSPAFPDFEQSGRYPYTLNAVVTIDAASLPAKPTDGDKLMAFVDGAPRAIVEPATETTFALEVRGKNDDETVTFKYYSAATGAVLRAVETTTMGDKQYGTDGNPQRLTFVPEVSMVAYVRVDGALAAYTSPHDKVAAFVDDICCGVGEHIGDNIYKVVVKGREGQTGKITFKYYNAHHQYMFVAEECIDFIDATEHGSDTEPYVLPINLEGKHPLKMTATFALPNDFINGATDDDCMAAFVGNECRGVATAVVNADGKRIYCMDINGALSGDERVKIKYYSAKRSYLYETEGTFRFVADTEYGTEEAPKQLVLVHVM